MMNRLLSFLIVLLISSQAFGQSDYQLFQDYLNQKSQNRKLTSITEFQLNDTGSKIKASYKEFNSVGLPVKSHSI